jgi:hypothetical protein
MTNPNHHLPRPTDSATTPPARRRRGTILGVGAGVLGGGLVGLAMSVPTFTDAAGTVAPTADDAVALQDTGTDDTTTDETTTDEITTDETTTDETTTDDTGDVARPMRGARLRESLQTLVDDGTLTAEQADAVAAHLAAQRPGPGGHRRGGGGHPGRDGEVVAELLGIDVAELRTAIRAGESIADLAEANEVDVQVVIDALVAEVDGHLDLAVEDGRLTEDEAAARLAEIAERITDRVHGERPLGR